MKKLLIGIIIAVVVVGGGAAVYETQFANNNNTAKTDTNTGVQATIASVTDSTKATPVDSAKKVTDTKDTTNKDQSNTDTKNADTSKNADIKNTDTNTTTKSVDANKTTTPNSSNKDVTPTSTQNTNTTVANKTTPVAAKTTGADRKVGPAPAAPTNITPETKAPTEQQKKPSVTTPASTQAPKLTVSQGTGNFTALSSYPFMIANLSNGSQIVIPLSNASKGSTWTTNGYFTNNIYSPVQFEISSAGNGTYNFYQMSNGAPQYEFVVSADGGSVFTGQIYNSTGSVIGTATITGTYEGSIQDGYIPGSMNYHPFYTGSNGQSNVTFVNLGQNRYIEYKGGSSSPYSISVVWNPTSQVQMELVETQNGVKIGKYDITSFDYSTDTYKGTYYHYVDGSNRAVAYTFSVSGSSTPN